MSDTIAAIGTAHAPAAIGILRLSGETAIAAADGVFRAKSGRALAQTPDRKLILGTLYDRRGRPLDEVLATVSRAPNSYTGEDTAELQCHGSPAVLAAGLEALFAAGARQAKPGEFTKRAFLNGRMDLTQAEAVMDLIDAQTADAAANAAGQVRGGLREKLESIYDRLVDVLSHFHGVLDYPDEDIEPFQIETYLSDFRQSRDHLRALAASFARGQILKNGVRAVIVGSPNAGKSSLLNALAGYERVIVTPVPGTTRDAVEETVMLGGVPVRLMDTAGIRTTDDAIEHRGVELAGAAAENADLALFVCDGSTPLTREDTAAMEKAKTAAEAWGILNKSDLPQVLTAKELPFSTVLTVSAKTGAGLETLEAAVADRFGGEVPYDGSILTNLRQQTAVENAAHALGNAISALETGLTPDAVLTDVEAALAALGEITGRTVGEEVVARIFERFCVGK